MRRRSVLKWTTLATIAIAIVPNVLSTLQREIVSAAASQTPPQTQGSLQVLDEKGKPSTECPLKHTDVKAQMSGFISRVTVTQDFENNFPEKIEAVYIFPLPPAAAVDDLTMLIGERTIKGKIMRREEARKAYEAAKQIGQVASLLDQERPNIFTQQVANILPGEKIRMVISYVETLKYEDGSYEWTFPMVVAPRYIPTPEPEANASEVTDTSRISPPSAPDGMRAGHDISVEVDLDAGMPIVGVNSDSHETEVEQINRNRAVVRLKDRSTIPNKDFLLTYRVAGDTINDAVLTHRSERGGFFTLILQPPQRVAAEDVMPKELVFVLDVSSSMDGFPIAKAKETMTLALNNLYPHDTFNLISFSDDTHALFSEPVFATPENVRKAKKFIANLKADDGTEMMKSVKLALKRSDSQHVRIACFMTDGEVGNDMEILSEVQKYPNARIFPIGFGDAPNRFLLDKMAEYGRGEVDYVSEKGDSAAVAQRFNDRIRNPLLTDISIDWSNLAVIEIYPKNIPDVFGVKPVIISGRYNGSGKGTIRLKGKLAGHDFLREIPIELPESQPDHDVLATLWARRRLDDLMHTTMNALMDNQVRKQRVEEITQLGLNFKLMTQYTSFIAIDETRFTGTDDPKRVDVPVEIPPGTPNSGINATVTVQADAASNNVGSSTTVGNTVTTHSIENLPVQGRSFLGLVQLAPGTTEINGPPSPYLSNLSVNGQRLTSNDFKVDGVSANFGIVPGGESPGPSAAGNTPALTASGGANGLATIAVTEEVRIDTFSMPPEYGRVSGGQVTVVTPSGTNDFRGSLFHFFGNDALDANDWFANSRSLAQPAKRLNIFGGLLGGPIKRNHTFFLASYEGLRLRQPMVGITDVPSLTSRAAAPLGLRRFLEAFPVPNGASRPDGLAEFASSFANPARHDVGSFNVDQNLNTATTLRWRYSFSDSEAARRGPGGLSLNTTHQIRTRSQTITGMLVHVPSSTKVIDVRANYSRALVSGKYLLDEFGGAAPPTEDFPASSFTFDLNSRNAGWMSGDERTNLQRQFNVLGSLAVINGKHSLKFGGDYRRVSPQISFRSLEESTLFDGVDRALAGVASRVSRLSYGVPQNPVFHGLSLFAQDEWRPSPRLLLTYGVRWELAPAPSTEEQRELAVDQVNDPTTLKLAAPGTPLWKTTFFNFAPRASVVYQLIQSSHIRTALRGGIGVYYDLGQNHVGDIFTNSIPFVSGVSVLNTATTGALPLLAFDPRLKVPYVVNWHVSLQRNLGESNSVTASYVSSSGNRLLHTETLLDQNPDFPFLRLTTNRGDSNYRALQVYFERYGGKGLTVSASYTLSRSVDNVPHDSARRIMMTSVSPELDRGPSDFDTRQQLSGHATYQLPAPLSKGLGNQLFRNWFVDSIFNAHSARPLTVVYMFPTSIGFGYFRPDVVNGTPLFIVDPSAPGGRRLDREGFLIPSDLQQGNLSRNSLRGFQFYQVNLALRRRFWFNQGVTLQVQADAFNLFNRANFEDPTGNDLVAGNSLAFGQSTSLSGRGLAGGGFPSFYGFGGARAMRFSAKLTF